MEPTGNNNRKAKSLRRGCGYERYGRDSSAGGIEGLAISRHAASTKNEVRPFRLRSEAGGWAAVVYAGPTVNGDHVKTSGARLDGSERENVAERLSH